MNIKHQFLPRILLVDKNPDEALELKKVVLSSIPCAVRTVDTVEEALHTASSWIPDLVISEWLLSDQTADQLLKTFKNNPVISKIPIIICTTTRTQELKLRAKRLGAYDFLAKPINNYSLKWNLDLLFAELSAPEISRKKTVRREHEIIVEDPAEEEEGEISRAKIKLIQDLAPMPEIAHRVLVISRDPNAGSRDLAEVIKQDLTLTAQVLRIVNSAFYGFQRKIGNIDRAIVILGFDEVVNITQAACLIQANLQWGDNPNFSRRKFWIHSLGAAYIARALCEDFPKLDCKDAFVMGLIHDFGKVVLDQYFREIFDHLIDVARLRMAPIYRIEKEIINIDHAEIGGIIAEAWRLPNKLVRAIKMHHRPALAAETEYEVHLAHLANCFCHIKKIGASGNFTPEEPHIRSLKAFGLENKDLEDVWKSLKIDVDSIKLLV